MRVWKRVLACKSKKNHETKLRHQDENGETSGVRLSSNFEFPYSARDLARCRRAAEIGTINEFLPWVGLCNHARQSRIVVETELHNQARR
jgi:hypothetical protein